MFRRFERFYTLQLSLSSVFFNQRSISARSMSSRASLPLANRVWIRCLPNDTQLVGKLTYPIVTEENTSVRGNVVQMNRYVTERLSKTLTRLSANIQRKIDKPKGRKRKSNDDQEPTADAKEINIKLFGPDGGEINGDLHNCHAWSQGSILVINDCRYIVELNPPSVVSLTLPKTLLSGFSVYPYVTLEFTSSQESNFSWFRLNPDSSETFLGDGHYYIPGDDDIGCRLKVVVTPIVDRRMGETVEAISINPVEHGPTGCPSEERHKQTLQHTDRDRYVGFLKLCITADYSVTYTREDYSKRLKIDTKISFYVI